MGGLGAVVHISSGSCERASKAGGRLGLAWNTLAPDEAYDARAARRADDTARQAFVEVVAAHAHTALRAGDAIVASPSRTFPSERRVFGGGDWLRRAVMSGVHFFLCRFGHL